jgi:excisionase family DNA binding protein
MSPEGFVDVNRAADFLGVKVSWMYEAVRLGRVPSYRIGVFRRFKLSELDQWARNGKGPVRE